jgi:hypothetical protein
MWKMTDKNKVKSTLFAYSELSETLAGPLTYTFGPQFGCGATSEVAAGQEITLVKRVASQRSSGFKLGGELLPIEANAANQTSNSLELGAKFTSATKWWYTSDRCETCRPMVTFLDATAKTETKFSRVLNRCIHKETTIELGPNYQINGNCEPAPQSCPGCADLDEEGVGLNPVQEGQIGIEDRRFVTLSGIEREGGSGDSNEELSEREGHINWEVADFLLGVDGALIDASATHSALPLSCATDRNLGAFLFYSGTNWLGFYHHGSTHFELTVTLNEEQQREKVEPIVREIFKDGGVTYHKLDLPIVSVPTIGYLSTGNRASWPIVLLP